jgi:hypothetical protein
MMLGQSHEIVVLQINIIHFKVILNILVLSVHTIMLLILTNLDFTKDMCLIHSS